MGTRDKEKASKQYKDWYSRNKASKKDYDKWWGLHSRYGLTKDEYTTMLVNQSGVCGICKEPEVVLDRRTGLPRSLSVDHCHSTGKIRGLLCTHCNHALGKFKDSIEVLESAIQYLKENKD